MWYLSAGTRGDFIPPFMRRIFLPLALAALALASGCQAPLAVAAAGDARAADNEELKRLYREDQADRTPPKGQEIDWSTVGPRDRAREARVKELYARDQLRTGSDYYHAALVLQHAMLPEDYLLAHEFCVAALAGGETRARWLAAATEDRFLLSIDRPQRFGTQYISEGGSPYRLDEMQVGVTDAVRAALDVPPLAAAAGRELPRKSAATDPAAEPGAPPAPNAAESTSGILGHWTGKAPDGSEVDFVFAPGRKLVWMLKGVGILNAAFDVRPGANGLMEVDFQDFDFGDFKGARFYGIVRIEGDRMLFDATRQDFGKTPEGFPTNRPTRFGADSVTFTRAK